LLRYSTFTFFLPLEVVFISSNFLFWFGPLSLSLKCEEDLISVCWDIVYLIFLRSSSILGRLHFKQYSILVWSTLHRLKIWGRSYKWLWRYSTFNNLRSSSICGRLHLKQYWILVRSPLFKFKIWERSNQWLLRYFSVNIFKM
jgi:hypothetical protein